MRFLLFCFLISSSQGFAKDYNILDFGATPDGNTLNTLNIQSAIDAAHKNGGGRVVIPSGKFLSGTVFLKSGVEIHLAEGAVLLGSTNPSHYTSIENWKAPSMTDRKMRQWQALIMADSEKNVSITGKGEINGQGRQLSLHIDSLFYAGQIDSADYDFVNSRPQFYLRPQLVQIVYCKNVQVKNVTFKDAASWVQTYNICEEVFIDSIIVHSDAYWNNDGLDIVNCKNTRITNCVINSSDDGICLKSHYLGHECDNIYIANCNVRSSASAVKLGAKSWGGFKNITIENIKIHDTFRSAIAIECVDGGILENILVNSIQAVNTGNAIFIRLGERNPGSVLRNVTLKNIKVEVPFERPDYAYEIRGPELPFFHNTFPSSITGIPGRPVENVTLENIEIIYPGRGNNGLANMPLSRLDDVPEKEKEYPEFSMFGELPAWGFYVRHVRGLTMKNVKLSVNAPDYRPACVFDDVHNLDIENMSINGDAKPTRMVLHNSGSVKMDNEQGVLRK